METHSKRNFFKSNLDIVLLVAITAVFTIMAGVGVFQKLDYRLYDIMLGTKKQPKSDEKIFFVDIDDSSLNELGQWPWSRDILGDALIRMKELGASRAVFDIEYLSESKLGVNPKAVNEFSEAFSAGEADISSNMSYLSDALSSGMYSKKEATALADDYISQVVDPALQSIYTTVTDKMFRDNDAYFAQAAQFFGNTWLTIGTNDAGIAVSDQDIDYLHKRFMFKNVVDKKNVILKENEYTSAERNDVRSLSPAIHSIISHAAGAGFTNVVVDKDGTRRRIELLSNFNNEYVGQLVFAPLLDVIKPQSIERKGHRLILHDVTMPGATAKTTVSIPLDEHGDMLINWLHSEFGDSFRHNPVKDLIGLDTTEDSILYNLNNFSQYRLQKADGYDMEYVAATQTLVDEYAQISQMKQDLLGKCKGYDEKGVAIDGGITDDDYAQYFGARTQFYADVKAFLDSGYDKQIIARLEELKNSQTAEKVKSDESMVNDLFSALRADYTSYTDNFNTLKTAYNGSFCIIGNAATGTTDLGVTPFRRSYQNVGTHANVLNTILQQNFITPINWLWGILFAFAVALLVSLLTRKMTPGKQNVFGVIYVVVPIGAIILLMTIWGVYVPVLTPALIVITSYIAETLYHFVTAERDKNFLRRAFSTYLSKDVVNVIVKDPSKLTLGGEDKHITALFSDVRSFSSFSEMVSPTKLVSVLNVYLGQLSDAIMDNHGTIDKYIGDEIVSFFGAPLDIPDHAYCACVAGIRMKQMEALYNKEHLASGDIPRELESRVGINTGNMVVGNMGTDLKMNYTIMGNDVNLASRLEGVNKMYHSWILASEQTWTEANSGEHEGLLLARRFDRVRVVGINKPVQLYNILGFKSELPEEQKQSVDMFHEALDVYLARDFKKAGKLFVEANKCFPADESPLVFAARCKDYLENGVDKDWDGVINMTSK